MADINWDNTLQRLIGAGTGLFYAGQGSRAADAGVGIAQDSANQRRAAYNTYASQLSGLAPSVSAAYQPAGGTVRTALATGISDPNTGEVRNNLDPRVQGLFDKYLQGAGAAIGQAGNFDPRALGQERLAQQQALLAPLRAAETNKMMRELAKKGLLGTASYDTGLPTEGGPMNPYMAALAGARAQADAGMAANALTEGENYLDRLLKRSSGLFGNAQAVSDAGARTGAAAADFGRQLGADRRAASNATTGLFKDAYQAQMMGSLPSADYDRARVEQAKADALRRGQTGLGAGGMFSDLLRGVGGVSGIGNLFSKSKDWFSGMFNTSYSNTPFDGFFVGPTQTAEMSDAWI